MCRISRASNGCIYRRMGKRWVYKTWTCHCIIAWVSRAIRGTARDIKTFQTPPNAPGFLFVWYPCLRTPSTARPGHTQCTRDNSSAFCWYSSQEVQRGLTHHVRIGCPLLGLEEDDLVLAARGALFLGAGQLDAQRVSKQVKDSKQARDQVRGCLMSLKIACRPPLARWSARGPRPSSRARSRERSLHHIRRRQSPARTWCKGTGSNPRYQGWCGKESG